MSVKNDFCLPTPVRAEYSTWSREIQQEFVRTIQNKFPETNGLHHVNTAMEPSSSHINNFILSSDCMQLHKKFTFFMFGKYAYVYEDGKSSSSIKPAIEFDVKKFLDIKDGTNFFMSKFTCAA
jgi:hypothetical protein